MVSFFSLFAFSANGQNVFIKATSLTGCPTMYVTFTDSVAAGFIPGTYEWTFSNSGWQQYDDTAWSYFDTSGIYTVKLVVHDTINGVSDSATVNVTVLDKPDISFTAQGIDCSGGCSGSIDVSVTGAGGGYSYYWSNSAATQDLSALCAGDYILTVTAANGCTDTAWVTVPDTLCDDSDPCTIDTCIGSCFNTPIVCDDLDVCTNDWCNNGICKFSPPNFTFFRRWPATFGNCDGALTLTPLYATPPYSIQWSPSLGCTDTCGGLCDGADYIITVTDSDGCVVIDTVSGGSEIGIEASDITGCAPLQVHFSDTVKPGSTFTAWQWSFGDGGSSYDQNPTHLYTQPGVYTVYLYAALDTNWMGYDSAAVITITVTAPCYATTASAVNASCPGTCDGEASVSVAGGAPPFSYLWSNAGTTQTITGLCAGVYHVTVTDSSGNLGIDTVIVGSPSLNASQASASCNGICNGWASAVITGGTGPYGYLWSNAATTQTITSLCAGTYTITLTDSSSGCVMSRSVAVVNAGTFTTSITGYSVRCDSTACNAAGYVWASTGQPPPQNNTFLWSNGSTEQWQNGLCMGTYYVTSTAISGCTKVDTLVVGFIPPDQVALNFEDTLLCSADTVTIEATTGPFMNYFWSNVATDSLTSSIDVWDSIGSAWWTVTGVDTGGCYTYDSVYVEFDSACVWPGDANYDGIANSLDVLAIGNAYSAAGPVREDASLVWDDQAAHFWADTFVTGVNYKHADCNGDGVVDHSDTVAVSLNYGFTHAKGGRCAAAPPLFVDLPDTLNAGQTLTAPIVLGDATDFVDGLYGVAFSIYYDIAIVDSNSVSVSFNPSWMGTEGVDMLGFYKNNPANGQTDVAITRIDHADLPQSYGAIGSIHFTIKDDVSGKKAGIPLVFVIDNVTAGSSDESEVFVCGEADSTTATVLTGVKHIAQASIQVYPNPANDKVFIESDKVINRVALTDLMGKTISVTDLNDIRTTLNVDTLPEGTYLLRLEFENSVQIRKVAVH